MRHEWTKPEEDFLCDVVAGSSDMMARVKASNGKSGDYWLMVAGIMWSNGTEVTGDACRKRWAQCRDRYFVEVRDRMFNADEAGAVGRFDEDLRKWDEVYAGMDVEDHVAILNRIEQQVDHVETMVIRLCQDLGIPAE